MIDLRVELADHLIDDGDRRVEFVNPCPGPLTAAVSHLTCALTVRTTPTGEVTTAAGVRTEATNRVNAKAKRVSTMSSTIVRVTSPTLLVRGTFARPSS